MPKKLISILPQIIASLFVAGAAVFAWTEPSQAPPQGNVAAPLNIGPTGQSKEGNLVVNADGSLANGLLVPYGNVGIGTIDPNANLDIVGRSGVANIRVNAVSPASDAYITLARDGAAKWAFTNDRLGIDYFELWNYIRSASDIVILPNSGNVGIGTVSPEEKLDVEGNIGTSGDVKMNSVTIKGDGSVSANLNAAKLEGKTVDQIQKGGLYGYCSLYYNLGAGAKFCEGPISPAKCIIAPPTCACDDGYATVTTGSTEVESGGGLSKVVYTIYAYYSCIKL